MTEQRPDVPDMTRIKTLMKQHQREAELELDEQLQQQVPGHVIYFVVVIVGAFVLNLLVLLVVAR